MKEESKVAGLNNTLKDVENELLRRAVDRRDSEIAELTGQGDDDEEECGTCGNDEEDE